MMDETWSTPAFATVARLVAERAGLALPGYRARSAEAGIRRAMARSGTQDDRRYRLLLESDNAVLDDLLVELTVGETYFFRDLNQLMVIRRQVLPEIRARRGLDHTVRAWSAGCASGEEAYTLAILFAEEGLAERARLHATDISRAAIAKARAATYSPWSLRGASADATRPYIRTVDGGHVVVESIRRAVTFDHLNLALDVYPSLPTGIWAMDLILCRNVLVYFNRETVQRVARRLYASLADGGWLVTAPSDPWLADDAPFTTVTTSAGILYRRNPPARLDATTAPSYPSRLVDIRGDATPAAATSTTPPPPASAVDVSSRLADATEAFVRGDYDRVVALTRDLAGDAAASVLSVRALANIDVTDAERACAEASRRHDRSAHLQALSALLLLELGRDDEAAAAARRAIYLDGELAVAHFTLATVLRRQGDSGGASRCYRRARDLCAARPHDEIVPLADGEHCGRLAEAADAQLAILASDGASP